MLGMLWKSCTFAASNREGMTKMRFWAMDLADLNEQTQERLDRIIQQMKEVEGVTEGLKADDPMLWVQRMNNIRNRAEEIIREELIYNG